MKSFWHHFEMETTYSNFIVRTKSHRFRVRFFVKHFTAIVIEQKKKKRRALNNASFLEITITLWAKCMEKDQRFAITCELEKNGMHACCMCSVYFDVSWIMNDDECLSLGWESGTHIVHVNWWMPYIIYSLVCNILRYTHVHWRHAFLRQKLQCCVVWMGSGMLPQCSTNHTLISTSERQLQFFCCKLRRTH